MSFYAVDKFCDKLMVVEKKKTWNGEDAHEYFLTEGAARQFIIDRAGRLVIAAQNVLTKAQARYRKCAKRYGP